MKNLQELKKEKENKVSELIKETGMFFAFSNEQFNENKTPLQNGEKYVSLGAGCYLPKSKVESYLNGSKEIDKWFKYEVKQNKLRKEHIIYELSNHEAWYTMDITDTLRALGKDFTEDEVKKVFWSEYKNQSVEY